MVNRVDRQGLQVAEQLAAFVENDVLPGTGVEPEGFWAGFAHMVEVLTPTNRALLETRKALQQKIDAWHVERAGQPHDAAEYKAFLQSLDYLKSEGEAFKIETNNVDDEIANVPGPQLVVPITNARYALNAANARWGSLYDALYGTDALGDLPQSGGYDPQRGARVIAWGRTFLNRTFPLAETDWSSVDLLRVVDGTLQAGGAGLKDAGQFVGYAGSVEEPHSIVLKNNDLHVVIDVNRQSDIGATDQAGISDIRLESAMTAIMDCEDSVACVDAEDKVQAYANWLGLMKGDLEARLEKGGKTMTRRLQDDLTFSAATGGALTLKGRALLLVRNVGHLMTNPAVLDAQGNEVFEGLMDALMTVTMALHDVGREGGNSSKGSVYVVKPKMHGPDEVKFAVQTFDMVEEILKLPANTVKIGIMDEERRTSVNLKECIRAAKSRVAFINTGFLDRTGDEIHTSMEAGPFSRKNEIKDKAWIAAYEALNVDIGLECGFEGRAQIGKGMWAAPDQMAAMLEQKIGHPRAGANCAWVPSPTAATLHATHYHAEDVHAVQKRLHAGGRRASVDEILQIPLAYGHNWTAEEIAREVENNAQGILGYVVRWIDHGVGCSKVPDINDVGLMEDRATCRISSQHIANWLHHGVVDAEQVMTIMRKMAQVVDRQNAHDPAYRPMAPGFDGIAFQAACDLVFKGRVQPSGYTEPVLHRRRLELKAAQKASN